MRAPARAQCAPARTWGGPNPATMPRIFADFATAKTKIGMHPVCRTHAPKLATIQDLMAGPGVN